jgi:HTH-type transcriptional regulator/antitoxin MqsA
MSTQYEVCHHCGSKMKRDVKKASFTYKKHSIQVDQPGWYCVCCDEILLTPQDIKETEADFLVLKARVEGLYTPEEIKRIRMKLKLSQRSAGEILGGGPRAFYKYEHGLSLLSRPMNNQLRLLERNPDRLNELRN